MTNITVTKIKHYTHVIKLTCGDTTQTERLLRDGLFIFHTRIPPSNIEQEKFTPIQICFKCYKFEAHPTNKCTSTTTICSECGQTGHRHFDCTATKKTCLNCPPDNNNHRTLAPSCPYRKKTIRDKEQRQQDNHQRQETETFASIVKTTIKETAPPPRPTINLTDKTHLKIVLLVIEAHIAALSGDRPYNDIIQESFRQNYNIDVVLPDRDSQKILDIYLDRDKQADKPTDMETTDSESDNDYQAPGPTPAPSPTKPKKTDISVKPKRKMTPDKDKESKRKPSYALPTDAPYSFKVLRSDKDDEPLPTTIDTDWIDRQINNRMNLGIKLHVSGDLKTFKQHFRAGLLIMRREDVKTIDDKTFQKYDRVTHYDRTH
jgi:hypothetical protein